MNDTMTRTLAACAAALAAATLATACGPDASEQWDDPLSVDGPIATGSHVSYLERTTGRVFLLDPTGSGEEVRLEIAEVPTGPRPGLFAASADRESLYVVDRDEETLQVIDVASASTVETVELSAAYDRIWSDPHGEFIVLGFSGSSDGTIVARNLNEISVVDLRDGGFEPTRVTLSSRPSQITFAPPFDLGGQPQRLAAVLSTNEATILDLLATAEGGDEGSDDENRLREVPLTISEADAVRRPIEAAFDVTPEEGREVVSLFVLTEGSDDVTQIEIQPAVAASSPLKLGLSVNQLASGQGPGQMEVLELPEVGTRLLTVDRNRARFSLVDVVSGIGSTYDLPMSCPATKLLPFQTTTLVDGEPVEETRVLAYAPCSALVVVIRPQAIAIAGDEPSLGQAVQAIRLEQRPERIELTSASGDSGVTDRAVVFHPGAHSGFSILDLRKGNDIPIQGGGLADVFFDGTLAYAVFQDLPNLSVFDLEGNPTNFELPARGSEVFVDEDGPILISHDDKTGSFTVLDGVEPTPERARVYENVFLRGLFQLELDDDA